ncbi:MAG: hypothetical protein JKY65_33545 [Planctomycetes bacterium]|nr:hypothetical protein [Planctomycetota bacterium]
MSLLLAARKFDFAKIQEYLNQVPWLWVGVAAGVILLVCLLFLAVRRWRARRSTAQPEVSGRVLVKVWKRFLAQIPGEFRRYVLHFQSFVVLGESGSGKSQLVDKCTDWKGQSAQFYPSYTAEPLLQIYLGSRVLVQEVPSSLLSDTNPKVRGALMRLWRRTGRKRPSIAVLTISAASLREASAESLREQAQMLRGKLNVLSRVANAPTETRIVVTHMDHVEGYVPFAEFVEKEEIPHQIQLDPSLPNMGLSTCLEPFEDYLSLALTKLPARDYLRVLAFLGTASSTFDRLGLFLSTLCENDPRSFEPKVGDLYLSSHTGGGALTLSNPFETSLTVHGQELERAVTTRHRWVAGVLLVLGLLWLSAGFAREQIRLAQARGPLETFSQEGSDPNLAVEAELALIQFEQGSQGAARLLPSYNPGVAKRLNQKLAGVIRERFLRPIPARIGTSASAHETSLYLLGLVYAQREGPLGVYILDGRIDEFARALKLPSAVVGTYVRASEERWAGTLSLGDLRYERRTHQVTKAETWHAFFLGLKSATSGQALTAERLAGLQERAKELREGLSIVDRRHTARDLFLKLKDDPHGQQALFEAYIEDLEVPEWLVSQRVQLAKALKVIIDLRMDVPTLKQQSLPELVYHLRGIQALAEQANLKMRIPLGDTTYTFEESRWVQVINDARMRALVQRFIHDNQSSGAQIFFGRDKSYPDIVMRPTGSGFLFAGKGVVAGEYTKPAYEREVVPQIASFEASLEKLDLNREARDELKSLVSGAAEQYASEYERQWKRYYESWDLQVDSLGALKLVLGHMKLSASRFQDLIQTIVDHTTLQPSTSPYLRTMGERLAAFRPIAQLLASAGPKAPTEIEHYRSILGRILSDLDAGESPDEEPAGEGPAEDAIDFEAELTPLGRLCFAIVSEHRDSYLLITEQWLKSAGITGRWRDPFLQPIRAIDSLGRVDIAAALDKSWKVRVRAQVVPLLEKFPFNPGQTEVARPKDLEQALHPTTGAFWARVRSFVAPICLKGAPGAVRWRSLKSLETNFDWPSDLFPVLNHLGELSATLWDKEGLPRPLLLRIRAEALPPAKPGQPAAILTFIGSGKAAVFGFNQRPTWRTLKINWHISEPAQVGLQLGTSESGERSNFALSAPQGYWALHRLLRMQKPEVSGASFSIATDKPGLASVKVRFSYEEDPFRLFVVPSAVRKDLNAGK